MYILWYNAKRIALEYKVLVRIFIPQQQRSTSMGLKLLDLSLCTVRGKKVRIHSTGEEASVSVKHTKRNMTFYLHFGDGRKEQVHWTADLQAYASGTDEIEEVDDVPVLA